MTSSHTRMSAETLEALRGSIAKWQERAAGKNTRASAESCPLCRLFNTPKKEIERTACDGCPVAEKTGQSYCDGTPYEDYQIARHRDDDSGRIDAAKRELEFLKSLLPPEAVTDDEVSK